MTQLDMERVASLENHPAFAALLKMLDEADELLLEKLEKPNSAEELENLNLWRASRRFKRLIQHAPASFVDELGGRQSYMEPIVP